MTPLLGTEPPWYCHRRDVVEAALHAASHRLRIPQPSELVRRGLLLPVASWLGAVHPRDGSCLFVGLSGSQGSGKSTLARLLAALLTAGGELRTTVVSLDDFYFTREERRRLAQSIHPLLATRGVPGTHDVLLLRAVLRQLEAPVAVRVPRFDKGTDDRKARTGWSKVAGPFDIVLLEGWCVGAHPAGQEALASPINSLEADEDPHGCWRHYVDAQLEGPYAELFNLLTVKLFLRAPDFETVFAWRRQQEERLLERSAGANAVMSDAQLDRFIAHFERVTRGMLSDHRVADAVCQLDEMRRPLSLSLRPDAMNLRPRS